jgi:NADH dehydrogenase/NADH:ubiquinone oxidoreductase subunit G
MSQATRIGKGVSRGKPVRITVDGEEVLAYRGETIGVAMLAAGRRVMRYTPRGHLPRGLFCAMGVCFECVVTVEGSGPTRSCITPVAEGMIVSTGRHGH